MIKVGAVLAQIEGGAASAKAAAAPAAPTQSAIPAAAIITSAPKFQEAPKAVVLPPQSASAYMSAHDALSATSVPAAPIVRAMALDAGVDLSMVPATGPKVGERSRVLEEDLIRFLSSKDLAPATSAPTSNGIAKVATAPAPATLALPQRNFGTGEEVGRKPVRGLRRVIAQAMVKSKYTAPHYSYVDEFECSELVALREQAKVAAEKYGVKMTYLPFIIKALVGALKEFPIANSSLEETPNGMELVYKKFYHIGFAVATNDGLVVPVIKHADKKTLLEIAAELKTLSDKVRAGKAGPDDLKGSTFSITSRGNIGGLFATPIINYPEVGILGVYKVQEKPIVKDGQIVIGKTMHLSLSLDHRVVDGAVGGAFCNAIIERLANPSRLLLEMA
jgi:pyruvate dehydrogenase E2 component (dihydrolipoamide acetyltransferase)